MSKVRYEDKKKPSPVGGQTAKKNIVLQQNTNVDESVTESTKKSSVKDNRKRNWTVVVYPESAPENWREILDDEHIEWVESPLHDKDINPDGSTKKPHWHIMLLFNGNKSYEQIKEITDKINAPIPKYVQSVRAMARYFAHLDNPEKVQYAVSKIRGHGGVDLAELLKPTASSRYEMIADMVEYIKRNEVTEFIDFVDFSKNTHYDDWFPLLCDSASFIIREVIKSNRHKPSRSLALEALTNKE